MKHIFVATLAAIMLVGQPVPAAGQTYLARYVSCHDGDTCTLDVAIWPDLTQRARVRLRGVDTPELPGRCTEETVLALKARDFLRGKMAAGHITVGDIGVDKYGRMLATVRVFDADVAEALIAAGLGRPYAGGHRAGWC